jgi:hypothetical protein
MGVVASLLELHTGWAWVVIIGNGLAGLWALGAHFQPALRMRALWWFTAFVETAVVVQVVLGVVLVAGEHLSVPRFHMFYGFVAVIAVAIIYSYRSQVAARFRYLLYGGGGIFVMGLGIRALLVGRT